VGPNFVVGARASLHTPCAGTSQTALRDGSYLPQNVHCRLSAATVDSLDGTSDSSQSWSYRLHCLPGARGDLERLPHHSLPPQSNDSQRPPAGSADPIGCFQSRENLGRRKTPSGSSVRTAARGLPEWRRSLIIRSPRKLKALISSFVSRPNQKINPADASLTRTCADYTTTAAFITVLPASPHFQTQSRRDG
jgi:hypothetical protein